MAILERKMPGAGVLLECVGVRDVAFPDGGGENDCQWLREDTMGRPVPDGAWMMSVPDDEASKKNVALREVYHII